MSEETIATENKEVRHRSKLLMLAVLLLSIAAVTAPILITFTFDSEHSIKKNSFLSLLVFLGIPFLLMLLIFTLAVRTRVVGDLVLVWYRWSRSEVLKAILLIIAVPLIYFPIGFLIHKLGLPLREESYVLVDQRGLAFYIILTIYGAVFGPILEELFWRGYIQMALERIFGKLMAFIVQAVFFAAYHFYPIGGFLQVFVFGLVMGAWRCRRRTLLPTILTHMVVSSLWCAAQWPDWLDCTRVRPTTDYVTEFIKLSKPTGYDPNDDAREEYANAGQLVVEFPEELREAHRSYPTQWSREEREQAEAWVVSNTEALEQVEKGAQKSCYWLEYEHKDSTVLSVFPRDLDRIRHFAYALCMRAKLRTNQGELEQGFSDVMCCYQLGKHLLRNKIIISQHVASAVIDLAVQTTRIILAHEEIEPMSLTRIQEQLDTFAESNTVEFNFMEEKFICLDVIQRIFTDDGHGGGHIPRSAFIKRNLPNGEFESEISAFFSVSESDIRLWRKLERHRTTAEVRRYYYLSEKACLMSPWEYNRGFNDVKISIERIRKRNPLIKGFTLGIDRLVEIAARSRANLDALIATLGILRYKADTQKLPRDLSELVATGYLKTVPDDPFSDGSITYRLTDEGFILYSFGADFDDDGGMSSWWGYGEQGGDQVFWPVQEPGDYPETLTETKTE